MKTINAVITNVSKNDGHGFAQAYDGKIVFINRRVMPARGAVGLEIEVGVVERYEAMRVRVVEANVLAPQPKPIATPAPRIDASELPPAVAKMVGLFDEPQARKTKRDRLKEI